MYFCLPPQRIRKLFYYLLSKMTKNFIIQQNYANFFSKHAFSKHAFPMFGKIMTILYGTKE